MDKHSPGNPQHAKDKLSPAQPKAAEGHVLDRYTVQPKSQDGKKDDSPYYQSQAPSISLPKGGGALKGIDEKFTVNAVNGTSSIQVGLPLTPGRGGFTPALSVSYNSGSGNSEFGLGWSLSLPSIQRKTEKKLPQYDDASESDVFLLAGAEDLVPVVDGSGNIITATVTTTTGVSLKIKRYKPRIEGLFARIEYIWNPLSGESWWRVTTKDNITSYYGLTADSRIADPEYGYRIFKWLPEVVCDHKGNVQRYFYKSENIANVSGLHERNRLDGLAPFANLYLSRVSYCNTVPWFNHADDIYKPGLPGGVKFLMDIVLDYGDHSTPDNPINPNQNWGCRHDSFSDFHAGFEIRTYRKCRRALMFHSFAELNSGAPTLVRSLDFTYQNDGLGTGDTAEADCITSITQSGYKLDGSNYLRKSLPPITLNYQPLAWDKELKAVSRKDAENAPQGLTGAYQWIDLWGEGLPGILTEQATGWFYKENLGNGQFTPALQVAQKPSFQGLGNVMQWQDLDADGRRQLVSRDMATPGYFELGDNERWQPFRTFDNNVNVDWNSPFTKLLDLDGDGRPDLLITEDQVWNWYKNEGTSGVKYGGQSSVLLNEEKGPRLILNDQVQRIFLADINGDGLTDLVRVQNGDVCYWPNKGYGSFGAKVTMSNAPLFDRPDDFNPQYITLADISGTGAADIIYLGNNRCTAWINKAGNAWSDAYEINPLPGTEQYSKVAVLDFLGNGTACIVWSSPLPQHAHAPMRYIDLMGGVKPYLLLSYQNGLGKQISLSYKSSSQFYQVDKAAGKPWASKLPFPVQCVSQIVTTDAVSDTSYTQHYGYHHGYYDHEEREFRGFGRVDTTDTDVAAYYADVSIEADLNQAPVLTKTWFHTGAWIREKSLLDRFRDEYFQFEGWDDATVAAVIPAGLDATELREAHRALKGQALRQEVYALDGSSQESIPYTVTANAYRVLKEQGRFANRFGSFYAYQEQSVVFSCERDSNDPRRLHELNLEVDLYGNVLKKATVVYPRRHIPTSGPNAVPSDARPAQGLMLITFTDNGYTRDIVDNNHYRLRMPATSDGYEITGITQAAVLWTPAELKSQIANATQIDYLTAPTSGAEKRLISRTMVRYLSNDTTTALMVGTMESLGLEYQHYALAFTASFLASGGPYAGNVSGTMLNEGGYVGPNDSGYWLPSGTVEYDANPEDTFYTPLKFYDPWNKKTTIAYVNNYWLMPESVTDAKDNKVTVNDYDWRILQPVSITDANDNISQILYDTLGMPAAVAVMGKDEADHLDGIDPEDNSTQANFWEEPETFAAALLQKATWRCVYDLDTQPLAVAMIAREEHYEIVHAKQNDDASYPDSPLLIRISYTDGMGRIAMHKVQAADEPVHGDPRWVGSGKTVYNNKGKAVLQYEPYFSDTHRYDHAAQSAAQANGVSPRMYYDPLGRLYRTEMPDGSRSYTVWDAWKQTAYDANDAVTSSNWAARRTGSGPLASVPEEVDARNKATGHNNTPTIHYLDTLARPFFTIQNDGLNPLIESREVLDIQGNRKKVVDGLGRDALKYAQNLLKAPINQLSIDSGQTYTLLDVSGQPLYHWDADGREFHIEYDDALHRPTAKWLDGALMLEKTLYGEDVGINPGDDKLANLRGQVYQHYDGGGLHQVDEYDFKGVPKATITQLIDEPELDEANWDTTASPTALDSEQFTTAATFDAFGRPMIMTDPGGNVTRNVYDKGGMLSQVYLKQHGSPETAYVTGILYNARFQREAIWYGNGTKTSYTYDVENYRLRRLVTRNVDSSSSHFDEKLQDLNYYYDPVGNITSIRDDAQETVFFDNKIVTPLNDYFYDALYRLTEANGRESIASADFKNDCYDNSYAFVDAMVRWDGSSSALQHYTQQYQYDAVGNILELSHSAGTGSYTRTYTYVSGTNRLDYTNIAGLGTFSNTYDARGNITSMPHLSAMNWNAANELRHVTAGTVEGYYQYSGGQRIRKWVQKTADLAEERIYLGNWELYRKHDGTTIRIERSTVHVADDTGRIAMLELRNRDYDEDGSADELTRYIYSNHLQSATLELNDRADVISYEEYHPYGTTAYQAKNHDIRAVAKRYRFTGKERDEESGLYYHGARYYISWLGRWGAVDPINNEWHNITKGNPDGNANRHFLELTASTYEYCYANPIEYVDPTGEQAAPTPTPAPPPAANPTPQAGNKPPQTGQVTVIEVIGANGVALPAGSPVTVTAWGTLSGPLANKIGQEIKTGVQEGATQAEGSAATITTTYTYEYGWEASAGQLRLKSISSVNSQEGDNSNSKEKVSPGPDVKIETPGISKDTAAGHDDTPKTKPTVTKPKAMTLPAGRMSGIGFTTTTEKISVQQQEWAKNIATIYKDKGLKSLDVNFDFSLSSNLRDVIGAGSTLWPTNSRGEIDHRAKSSSNVRNSPGTVEKNYHSQVDAMMRIIQSILKVPVHATFRNTGRPLSEFIKVNPR